jgi:hypothetical protein
MQVSSIKVFITNQVLKHNIKLSIIQSKEAETLIKIKNLKTVLK